MIRNRPGFGPLFGVGFEVTFRLKNRLKLGPICHTKSVIIDKRIFDHFCMTIHATIVKRKSDRNRPGFYLKPTPLLGGRAKKLVSGTSLGFFPIMAGNQLDEKCVFGLTFTKMHSGEKCFLYSSTSLRNTVWLANRTIRTLGNFSSPVKVSMKLRKRGDAEV